MNKPLPPADSPNPAAPHGRVPDFRPAERSGEATGGRPPGRSKSGAAPGQKRSLIWPALLLALLYLVIAGLHSLIVPLTAGNDEWAHFLYTRFIALEGRLPATWPEREAAGYKSDAPPLYHLLVAGATAGVEPVPLLRRLDSPRRRLADNRPDPYALVHTAVEFFPYRGEVLLWHLGRGLSILFGLALLGVTYLTSLELFPDHRRALTTAALLAFIPAFIFHSSVLSYESLSALLTALFLLAGIKAIKQPARWRWWIVLGGLAGLAVTTKYSAVLLPLEMGVIGWLAGPGRRRLAGGEQAARAPVTVKGGALLARLVVAGAAALLAAGWWFGFVGRHFNTIESHGPVVGSLQPLLVGDASDTTSVEVAGFLFGDSAADLDRRPPLARNYGRLFLSFIESFWAAPVAGRFILSPWLPLAFTLVTLGALPGLWLVWRRAGHTGRGWLILLLVHALLITPLLALRIALSFDPREAAQGRHLLLPAASALVILWVWGWRQWRPQLGRSCVAGLLLWSVLGQVGWAAIRYPSPLPVWPAETAAAAVPSHPEHSFADALQLTGATWQVEGPVLEVTLWWTAPATLAEDYLVELALLDETGRPAGYSLSHPVQGRYPTRAWEAGDRVKDTHRLPLTNPEAGTYDLRLRLLDRAAQPLAENKVVSLGDLTLPASRLEPDPCAVWFQGRPDPWPPRSYPLRSSLTVIAPAAPVLKPISPAHAGETPLVSAGDLHIFLVDPDWAASYRLVVDGVECGRLEFDLPARRFTPPEIARPVAANFNNELLLLGYDLPVRRIQPGERLPLTLYWQALAYMGRDYRMFDNLLDREQRRWGGYDRRAKDGYSTLLWTPGEVITDSFGVPIDPEAPPGIYTLDIGWYEDTETGLRSLPLVVAGQPTGQTGVRLGPIKVGGPPPEVVVADPDPQVLLDQSFGEQITLLGYDLTAGWDQPPVESPAAGPALTLTLYWRADALPPADYTTFLHLRDAANHTAAQKDAPPAGGRYPTSLWEPGEVIVDAITLPLDQVSSGRYTPTVGLYDGPTGERLLTPGRPANEIPLQPVEVP